MWLGSGAEELWLSRAKFGLAMGSRDEPKGEPIERGPGHGRGPDVCATSRFAPLKGSADSSKAALRAWLPAPNRRWHAVTPLMNATQAAELLGVPPSWLLAQARRRAVPHVRLGRYVRFREVDIEQLIAAGAAGSTDRRRPYRSPTTMRDRAEATAGPLTPEAKS